MSDLRECPFCGSTNVIIDQFSETEYAGSCEDKVCMLIGPSKPTREEAAAAWNRRAPLVEATDTAALRQLLAERDAAYGALVDAITYWDGGANRAPLLTKHADVISRAMAGRG